MSVAKKILNRLVARLVEIGPADPTAPSVGEMIEGLQLVQAAPKKGRALNAAVNNSHVTHSQARNNERKRVDT